MDAPTGFMLIKRNVFNKMKIAYPHLKFTNDQHIGQPHETKFKGHDTSDWNYAFFDTMIDPDSKRYLSEDYAFCRLWQKIDGTVLCGHNERFNPLWNLRFQRKCRHSILATEEEVIYYIILCN